MGFIFKDIHGFGEPYVFIHPHKQKAAKHLVDNRPEWVDYIVIFGSATGAHHFYKKDLDVCIIGKDPQSLDERNYHYQRPMRLAGVAYDFLDYDSLEDLKTDGRIYKEILSEGVVIYAKKGNTAGQGKN